MDKNTARCILAVRTMMALSAFNLTPEEMKNDPRMPASVFKYIMGNLADAVQQGGMNYYVDFNYQDWSVFKVYTDDSVPVGRRVIMTPWAQASFAAVGAWIMVRDGSVLDGRDAIKIGLTGHWDNVERIRKDPFFRTMALFIEGFDEKVDGLLKFYRETAASDAGKERIALCQKYLDEHLAFLDEKHQGTSTGRMSSAPQHEELTATGRAKNTTPQYQELPEAVQAMVDAARESGVEFTVVCHDDIDSLKRSLRGEDCGTVVASSDAATKH